MIHKPLWPFLYCYTNWFWLRSISKYQDNTFPSRWGKRVEKTARVEMHTDLYTIKFRCLMHSLYSFWSCHCIWRPTLQILALLQYIVKNPCFGLADMSPKYSFTLQIMVFVVHKSHVTSFSITVWTLKPTNILNPPLHECKLCRFGRNLYCFLLSYLIYLVLSWPPRLRVKLDWALA